jgi:hypothetical protein
MQYYRICADPSVLSDTEWAIKYAILEDIRNKEKKVLDELGRIYLPDQG